MAYSEAQKKAVKKYNEKSYDEIKVRVKKGSKDIIQKYAESQNETVNGMINRLLENEIPNIKEWIYCYTNMYDSIFLPFYIVPSMRILQIYSYQFGNNVNWPYTVPSI